jgi:hypothetical protein
MLALLTHAEHEGTGAFWEKRGDAAPPGPGRLQRVEWHMLSRYLAALCSRDRVGVVSTANKAYRFNAGGSCSATCRLGMYNHTSEVPWSKRAWRRRRPELDYGVTVLSRACMVATRLLHVLPRLSETWKLLGHMYWRALCTEKRVPRQSTTKAIITNGTACIAKILLFSSFATIPCFRD